MKTNYHLPVVTRRLLRQEVPLSQHIPIVRECDPSTLLHQEGHLIRLFHLTGIDVATLDPSHVDHLKQQRALCFQQLPPEVALYCWVTRKSLKPTLTGDFSSNFYANQFNSRYQETLNAHAFYHNEWTLALIQMFPGSKQPFVKRLSHCFGVKMPSQSHVKHYAQLQDKLEQTSLLLEQHFKRYGIKRFELQQHGKFRTSETLSFLSFLLNQQEHDIPEGVLPIPQTLARVRLLFNHSQGILSFCGSDGSKRVGALLSIKQYPPYTWSEMLDRLLTLPLSFTLTQSYRPLPLEQAKRAISHQQQEMVQSSQESQTQTNALDETFERVAAAQDAYGLHHLSCLLTAKNVDELNESIATVIATLSTQGIAMRREDVGAELAFWAQLPGQFPYVVREATVSSTNLASLMSFHNAYQGKAQANHWGACVSVLETPSYNPFYFNFHHHDVGNTLIYGAMGAGKTTLAGFLILQSIKFGGKTFIVDQDHGLEILVRALGGAYYSLQARKPTYLNPCCLEDTIENRAFLVKLLNVCLSTKSPLSDVQAEKLAQAVDRLYQLPQADRHFKNLAPLLGVATPGSLRERFAPWVDAGEYAWVFDHAIDAMDLNQTIVGIDLGSMMEDEVCKVPCLMVLLHVMEQAMQGHRGKIFIDEGWKALSDPYFQPILEEYGRTPRKKNHFLCLMTQCAEDTANHIVSKTLHSAASCKIFFPNVQADRSLYCHQLGLSQTEFELVKTLPAHERYFLLSFEHGAGSVVARVNLAELPEDLDVISGRTETVAVLRALLEKFKSSDPSVWLPLFHQALSIARKRNSFDSQQWMPLLMEHVNAIQ